MAQREPYYIDLDDDHSRNMLPLDFADWLRTRDRNDEAEEFLARVNHYVEVTPSKYRSIEHIAEIASDFAPIRNLADDKARRHQEAMDILSKFVLKDEDTDDEVWNREDSMDDHMAPTPVDMDRPEFDVVEVYFYYDDTVQDLAARTLMTLLEEDFFTGAQQFAQDAQAVMRRTNDGQELFRLIWSYVTIVPEDEREAWGETAA